MTALALPYKRPVNLNDRRTYLGGSDTAAALGLDPWKSRAELWLEKTGRVDPVPILTGPAYWGTKLEAPIAKWWSEETGFKLRRRREAYVHPKLPWLVGHIDRQILGHPERFLEVKTANQYKATEWGDRGTDEIPLGYRLQITSYQACNERFEWGDVAALIGGQDARDYAIERSASLIYTLEDRLKEFWLKYVCEDIEPPALSVEEAKALWPIHQSDTFLRLESGDPLVEQWQRWHELEAERKQAQQAVEAIDAKLEAIETAFCEAMRDSEEAYSDELQQNLAQWKQESRAILDQRALRQKEPHTFVKYQRLSVSRVFRMKKKATRRTKR